MKSLPPLSDDDRVTRHAPRWAWEIIDECLALDARSLAADRDLRAQIADALAALVEIRKVEGPFQNNSIKTGGKTVKLMLEKSYGIDFIEFDLDPKTAGFVLDAFSKARFYREPYLPGGERAFVEQRKPEICFETLTENGSYVFECEADFEAWKEARKAKTEKEVS